MNFLEWLGFTLARDPLDIGDAAPDVVSCDEQGSPVHLAEVYSEGLVFIYFYPKAETPGCTAQACSLRDGFEQLTELGVQVFGVSSDKPEAQLRFKQKYRLPFSLLADYDHVVARAFGVRLMIGLPQRQAFLIKDGRVVWRDLTASTREQAQDVLGALKNLS